LRCGKCVEKIVWVGLKGNVKIMRFGDYDLLRFVWGGGFFVEFVGLAWFKLSCNKRVDCLIRDRCVYGWETDCRSGGVG
jgi:hypothetical protein